ncbi:MAG: hypothetical protein PHN47_01475 [Clostridia bacterium]|jgi:predicted thioesterase|nr:hypothetical protein [Clostridia bacterium]
MIKHGIQEGLSTIYKKETTVADAHTSSNSGMLDFLLSTPAVIKMVIDASSNMLDKLLPQDYITVGRHLQLTHEKPTIIGENITIKITVTKLEHNTVFLAIQGEDAHGVFCTGEYERTIVDRNRLLNNAYKRSQEKA